MKITYCLWVDVSPVSIHKLYGIWYVWMPFIQKNKNMFPEWWKTMFHFRTTSVHLGPSHTFLTGLSLSLNISNLWLLWLFNTRLFPACLFCMDCWTLKRNVKQSFKIFGITHPWCSTISQHCCDNITSHNKWLLFFMFDLWTNFSCDEFQLILISAH